MMEEETFKALFALSFAIVLAIGIGVYVAATEPRCPAGSEATVIHSTWYCVVPQVKQ